MTLLLFKVEIKCPIPTVKVKVTSTSRNKELILFVTGDTLPLVKVAITRRNTNAPSTATKSQLGPTLTFDGRSAYSTPMVIRARMAFQWIAPKPDFCGLAPGVCSNSPEVPAPF
jgi:hypothetical protein